MYYVAANNGKIMNEGEYDLYFTSMDGSDKHVFTFQIAEVNKALCSVSWLTDHGYKVVFDQDPVTGQDISMIQHKASGVITRLSRERNVWKLDAVVYDNIEADFVRQG